MTEHKIGCVQHDCAVCVGAKEDAYAARVRQLENIGTTTSDAQAVADYEEECGRIKDSIFKEILVPTISAPTYEYIHNEEVGMGVFDIIRLPNTELLFSFKDKYGYFNIFKTMEDFLAYMGVNGLVESDHVSFPDEYPFPEDPDYEEGVDALDLYLRSLV